jgi:poly-gamma-glutamate synthesis protein (capsule biosynthesis protein)
MDKWNRQAFIDRHIFYNGRHISTELITIILEDYARPRLMTSQEREKLLKRVFGECVW